MTQFKKLTSVILSLAILASALIIGGVFPGAETAADITAEAIDLDYGETYTFNFDKVNEYKANTDTATDAEGNVFYPWRSADANATAKGSTITYGGAELSALELSASGSGMYIPTDENGQPLVIEPNATYQVTITSYALALGSYKQLFLGGGIYEANKPAYSNGGDKTFPDSIAWADADYDMTALYPLYRTKSLQYAGSTAVYFPEYRQRINTLYFNTGDYDAENGLITALASDGEYYKFANYFGILFVAGKVAYSSTDADGDPVTYNGNSVVYIDSISLTKTAGMDIGESYTFDFDNVLSTTAEKTAFTDGEGNTFYPLHSTNTGVSAVGTNIDVTKTDGTTETMSALKLTTGTKVGYGYTQYIPTDENGLPFVVEPNTTYEIDMEGYIEKAGGSAQIFYGAGAFHSDQAAYDVLNSNYNTSDTWYYINGTDKGKLDQPHLASGYPFFRGNSFFHASTARDFTDQGFDQNNTSQYKTVDGQKMITNDFEEGLTDSVNSTVGNNLFNADLWKYYSYVNANGTNYSLGITDPYSDLAKENNVEIKSESVGSYFTITCGSQNCVFYIDKITITKVSQTASVTYDANGGSFSDDTTTKTITEQVGGEITAAEPSYSDNTQVFGGWSLSAGSKIAVDSVDASLNGKTLYAIWNEPAAHPANGVYDTFTRTIEFDKDKYFVTGENSFIPTGEAYGEYSGVPYFTVVDDPDEEGDSILHYYNHSAASNWKANWSITPTVDGVSSDAAALDGGQVLSTGSTYRMTFRLRINDTDGGTASICMYYGTTNGRNSITLNETCTDITSLKSGLEASEEWQDITVYFDTPAEYTTFENGKTANRLFVGVLEAKYHLDYDLDYIKLEKVTSTELYINTGSGYVLHDTLEGVPGTELTIPEYYSEETYSLYDPTGSDSKMIYGSWYADEDCTETPVMKYGNYDTALYCDEVTNIPSVSTENQEMYVGFDTYTQRTEGLSGAAITDETFYSGSVSLKSVIAANGNSAFELKNDHILDVADGKTYKVDFMYKADAEASLGIGLATGLVANGVNSLNTTVLKAADDWTAASVTFTADGAVENSVLAAALSSVTGATVYIDSMIVSSVTESVGVEATTTENGEALRFMLNYTGSDTETVKMAGVDYTVTEHGVLVKGQDIDVALNLENTDTAGIYHFAQTDISKNWSVNPITGTTVYSAYLEGFETDDDYKVSVRGYVKLSDGSVFYTDTLTASVTDIPAAADIIPETADLTDYYVYLPAGTALPADADYTVSTYDSTFNQTSAIENNTITEDSYVLFSAMPEFSKINVPSEVKYLVHAGAKADLYYGIESQIVTEKINSVGADTVNYLFITDIHFGSNLTSAQNVSLLNQATLMTRMANENDNIDFVVIGGDTTTGMYGSKEDCVKWTQAALDPFLECTKPVFVLMGNHDDNSYHLQSSSNTNKELYEERIITDLDWQNYIIDRYTNKGNITVVQDDAEKRANSKYFYYDLEGKKTRVIALDALDYEARYDENGYVIGDLDGDGFLDGMPIKDATKATDSAKYYHGCNYWGYSADQMRWLAEDALGDLPEDFDVIFVSHMGIDMNTNAYGTKIWFGENIREIIKAFNAGGTYTADLTDNWGTAVSVNADFSSKTGDILSWQFGHQHIELTIYESDVDLWQICTPSSNVGQSGTQTYEKLASGSVNNKSLPWRVYTRKLGDKTEASFNAMSVSSERVYRFTVGQGNNEKLVYSK